MRDRKTHMGAAALRLRSVENPHFCAKDAAKMGHPGIFILLRWATGPWALRAGFRVFRTGRQPGRSLDNRCCKITPAQQCEVSFGGHEDSEDQSGSDDHINPSLASSLPAQDLASPSLPCRFPAGGDHVCRVAVLVVRSQVKSKERIGSVELRTAHGDPPHPSTR